VAIAGSVAVVTGASSGIGRAVAVGLAGRGATVVVAARRVDRLEATAATCRERTPASLAVPTDVGDGEQCRRLVATAEERLGRVDIVVNDAGVSLHRHALDTGAPDVERVLRVNFLGAVHTTLAALPGMVRRAHGAVVNVTSVAGYLPNPKESAYGASKAALHLWTHGLAVDLHGTGVHLGTLSPGPVDTEIWDWDETPSSYRGRKYPPELVADGVARMIERRLPHLTVPRRYGAVGILYALPLVSRAVRRGLVAFEQAGQRRTDGSHAAPARDVVPT
jgi:NAD(P)-dependent dehydrogenase (short-subunit alcohol dehydrogenase family)